MQPTSGRFWPSELSAHAHPVDLMFLAGMYLDKEIPNLGTARERALKFWELSERAALTGYEAAVIELANVAEKGLVMGQTAGDHGGQHGTL